MGRGAVNKSIIRIAYIYRKPLINGNNSDVFGEFWNGGRSEESWGLAIQADGATAPGWEQG